ncbi:MAG: gamma-glutamyl-gamma-aminobutyrate hydrolase family protein [Pseudanabaena sp. RU_4_16]|nr:gamma-glutamyl-gamma-aminobutyrate hydrolase family protein [Pseudanabaena sp. SU_2_4]NJM28250.1 gamma-glutamyl-gamma-aminobutyrate hydrolase family protein [Pseudanabaena sp. RU_4_16]
MRQNASQRESPIIGITAYGRNEVGEFTLQAVYVDAVRKAGGIPILLPPGEPHPDRILQQVDGLILAGGGDIDPAIYGGDEHPTIYSVDAERDEFELALAEMVIAEGLPVLGICRGMQVLGVASGGNLVSHVPDRFGDDILHRLDNPRRPTSHTVEVTAQSRLAQVLKVTNTEVTSWHHQAVQSVSNGWSPVAFAPDGLIEAIEHQDHPWAVAVQWHPELLAHCPAQKALFYALVEAASS